MECATPLPLGACFLRAIKFHGSFSIFDFTGHSRLGLRAKSEAIERATKFITDGLVSNLLPVKIDRIFFGLDEYAAAHRYLETNAQVGKIVVSLSDENFHTPISLALSSADVRRCAAGSRY